MAFLSEPRADDPRPIYIQIMDEVRKAIVRGALQTDDPVPSARQVARDLHVNPNTVRQAYRELEREGVLRVRRGKGSFVAPAVLGGEMRARVCREIAENALREAWKSGISPNELQDALAELAARDETPADVVP